MRLLGLVLFALWPVSAAAQAPDLAPVADQARKALVSHDIPALLGPSTRVLVQLPTASPSAPVGQAHAAALLKAYFNDFDEVSAEVRSTSPVSERSATVEVLRRYRVPGTSAIKQQSVLLAYQLVSGRWVLSEVRVTQ